MSEIELWRAIREIKAELDQIRALSRLTYAKGSYAPTNVGGTSAGTTTYSQQQGWYWKIGQLVFVTGQVVWTTATGTGDARISVPFTPSASAGFRATGSLRLSNVTFTTTTPELLLEPTAAFFTMHAPVSNNTANVVQMEAAGLVTFSLCYGVDP